TVTLPGLSAETAGGWPASATARLSHRATTNSERPGCQVPCLHLMISPPCVERVSLLDVASEKERHRKLGEHVHRTRSLAMCTPRLRRALHSFPPFLSCLQWLSPRGCPSSWSARPARGRPPRAPLRRARPPACAGPVPAPAVQRGVTGRS